MSNAQAPTPARRSAGHGAFPAVDQAVGQAVDDRGRVTILARSATARRFRSGRPDPRARSDRNSGGKLIDLRDRFGEQARPTASAAGPAENDEPPAFSAEQERRVTEIVLGHRRHGLHL